MVQGERNRSPPQTIDQRDPDRDYARFREETVREQQSVEALQKQQKEINLNPTGPAMTMDARSLAIADSSSSGDGGGDGGGQRLKVKFLDCCDV